MVIYRQCRMSKPGFQDVVAFIPDKHARVQHVVVLKDDDGWIVQSVGLRRWTSDELRVVSNQHRTHRRDTDS